MSNYFVMLNHQKYDQGITPIVDDNDDVALFGTVDDARSAMSDHPYAQAHGFEIFQRGGGE